MMWILLITAGLLEVVGVIGIEMVNRQKTWHAWFVLFSGFGLSFLFLSFAMESIPMGIAYGIWTGIGTAGSALVGILIYKEPCDARRFFFLFLIIFSVIGLKFTA